MTWFKVDDSFYDHPKVFDASDAAVALWTRAGSWAARNLTDGFVPSGLLARLSGDPVTAAKELVDRGLWKRTRGGFQFHDWAEYQPSKERVESDRKAAAVRQANYRKRSKSRTDNSAPKSRSRDGNGDTTSVGQSRSQSDNTPSSTVEPSRRDSRVSNSVSNGVSHTTPTRPSLFTRERGEERAPAERGAALAPPLRDGARPSSHEPEDERFWTEAQREARRTAEATTAAIAEQQRTARSGAALARAALQAKEVQRADPS